MNYYIRLLRGKTRALKPAKITFKNIFAILQAFFRKARRGLGGLDLPNHLYEQIIWRRTSVLLKSPECWIEGHCIHCGCDILGKTMEDRACENDNPCYPVMMSKETWETFKRTNNIKLFE